MRSRPVPGTIPEAPGSYQFVDASNRVLYVGKAKSLRSRITSYLADPATLAPRTAQMVGAADHVEWIQVGNEVEAILLEYALIKQHRPRYNIRLVDDKSYPYLAVTLPDEWPRASVVRGRKKTGVRYFGPYAHVGAIRDTLDLLLRSFPVRTCSDSKLERHQKLGRPCLLYHIERCSGPCIGAVERDRYDEMVRDLTDFLAGATDDVETRLTEEMNRAAEDLDFERAARVRDRLSVLRMACERQQVVTERPEDIDVVGIADDALEAAACVFHVRRGRVVGRRAMVLDKVEEISDAQLVGRVLEELYAETSESADTAASPARRRRGDPAGWVTGASDPHWLAESARRPLLSAHGIPRTVLVPELPDDLEVWQRLLEARRHGAVEIRVARRGGKRALMETVVRNAGEELARHRLRRASDHDSRTRALRALQDALDLPHAPLRIECYDMSHLQGTAYVGSMVVFEDGLPRKGEYRRFRVREVPGNDDYAAMEEVLTRRLRALLAARSEEVPTRAQRFAYPPQLLLLDGGKGQLGVGIRVLEQLGLRDQIPVAALAKTFEEVFVPGRPDPLRIPRGSDALYLLQQLRDEAHRFAITYHRSVRAKSMTASGLDEIPGLGPARRARLLRAYGSMKALRRATADELRSLSWLPDNVAAAVFTHLHPHGAATPERTVPAPAGAEGEDGDMSVAPASPAHLQARYGDSA
ncbi:MAG: excinuclease ABC subunit UvrC [Acidimicrobiales bacterium]